MAKFNKTEPYTFKSLCNVYETFDIPNFQRPYSWKNKNLSDFFSSIHENDMEYFIGNIVAINGDPIRIVDGQQRLITISLLLCAVRESLRNLSDDKNDDRIKSHIENISSYLINKDLESYPPVTRKRLKLGKQSYQEVYEKIVDNRMEESNKLDLGDNEKRIIGNYKILTKFVENYIESSKSKLDKLEGLLKKILSLQVILILCESDNDVYRIFEGFNSTGLGLSVADLLKNAVLRATQIDAMIQNDVETVWMEMEELFNNTRINKFPKFLRHQWISNNGYILMSNLFKEIKEQAIERKSPSEIYRYVENLSNDAKVYIGMQYKQYEKEIDEDEVLDSVRPFRYLNNEQVYEVLLIYYHLLKNRVIRVGTFRKCLEKLWVFVVRSMFISVNPSDYEKLFAKHCTKVCRIKDSNEFSKNFDTFINSLSLLVNDDDQFIENLVLNIRFGRDNNLIKKIIITIMENEDPAIKINRPEIEHILPREPEKWGLEKTEVREYVHKLGNLTLLFEGDNKAASNEMIDVKCEDVFSKSKFKFNNNIDRVWKKQFETDWKKAIDSRGIEIASIISKLWRL